MTSIFAAYSKNMKGNNWEVSTMPIKYHGVLETVFLEAKGLEKINSFFSIQKCLKSRFSGVDKFKSHISHGSLL